MTSDTAKMGMPAPSGLDFKKPTKEGDSQNGSNA
jgi:hypothetical protein